MFYLATKMFNSDLNEFIKLVYNDFKANAKGDDKVITGREISGDGTERTNVMVCRRK